MIHIPEIIRHLVETDARVHARVETGLFLCLVHIPLRFQHVLLQFQQLGVVASPPAQSLVHRNLYHARTGRELQFDLRILVQIEERRQGEHRPFQVACLVPKGVLRVDTIQFQCQQVGL